ncbi:MAG TPA: DNA-binding domain-containing protein [Burkholderiaceae bacterium]|nr:DNA-binding domain-containing protein [Burkholderiaceae bacterium]
MTALRELQSALADAILARDTARFAARVRAHGMAGAERVQVYQNNVFISLTQALADVYPVVARLVGEAFFRFAARRYIQAHPSRSGNLIDFGGALPQFLRALPEAQTLPYLGDVAALEWAYHEVFHAGCVPDDATLFANAGAVMLFDRLRIRLHPASRLVASSYPILAIWQLNREDAEPAEPIHLDAGGDHLLVARRDLERRIEPLTEPEFALLSAVAAGHSLAQACEAALAVAREQRTEIDIGAMLVRFAADRTLVGFNGCPQFQPLSR